jgi:hypothetical protein
MCAVHNAITGRFKARGATVTHKKDALYVCFGRTNIVCTINEPLPWCSRDRFKTGLYSHPELTILTASEKGNKWTYAQRDHAVLIGVVDAGHRASGLEGVRRPSKKKPAKIHPGQLKLPE